MRVFYKIAPLRSYLDRKADDGKSVGFVPTMGALHEAHLSLIEYSANDNDITTASIFVNPKQFNNPADLEHYPRMLDKDLKLLQEKGCDVVFAPSVEEMYPEPVLKEYDFGQLDKVMEGKFRPGHFNGVAIVVKRLFDIIKPDKAYFGKKDFQQLTIIQELVRIEKLPIEIIPCPTLREPDGLAMSSRNIRLTESQRAVAAGIYATLQDVKKELNHKSIDDINKLVSDRISSIPEMKLEYFEIVDSHTLMPISSKQDCHQCIACIAVYLGEIRLIDNMMLN